MPGRLWRPTDGFGEREVSKYLCKLFENNVVVVGNNAHTLISITYTNQTFFIFHIDYPKSGWLAMAASAPAMACMPV